ncbi:MAG TPA: crosslink repair DNA glycosylase YcaQ family protein, partial [Anaerolineae bacterium]
MASLNLTPTLARRLAITRQRLAGPRPEPTPAGIMEIMRDLGCIQIDPIRAVERTQFLVLWSRLGHYDPAHLDTLLWEERQLFEYWAHAASIVLTEDYPIHQAQMRRLAGNESGWSERVRAWLAENQAFRQHVLDRLRQEAPLASREFKDLSIIPWKSTGWTNDRNVDRMLGFLWEQGDIMVTERKGLQKKWGLTEQHLPDWTPREVLSDDDVVRRAAEKSLWALGVGTAKHINNHFIRG